MLRCMICDAPIEERDSVIAYYHGQIVNGEVIKAARPLIINHLLCEGFHE